MDTSKELLTIGIGLAIAVVALAFTTDITHDVKATSACASTHTFFTNGSFPDGVCCDTVTYGAGNCSPAAHRQAFTLSGNVSSNGEQGLLNIASQTPTIGTVAGISLILFLLIRVGLMVKEQA